MTRLGAIFLILIWGVTAAWSQAVPHPPALLADQIDYIRSDDTLVATGNVRFSYKGRTLRADRVVFENRTGQLRIDGNISIIDPDGAVLEADAAELDTGLEAGLIHGARLLLAENFQFAAVEARRVDARTTTLYKAVGSACQVCADHPIPLWLVRADRIVRDEETLQIHFKNARFDIAGIPVGYLPYFRMADPSVDRATGFLNPDFRRSDIFGFGLSLPYYMVLSDDADLTITPFVTTSQAAILGGEFRKRFANGRVDVTGSFALRDGEGNSMDRGHLFIDGDFKLRNDWDLMFGTASTSDKTYLAAFGFDDRDRLESRVTLSRQRSNSFAEANAIGFQTLRDGEIDAEIPYILPELRYTTYHDLTSGRGRLDLDVSTVALLRRDGRDVLRVGGAASWRNQFQMPGGLIGTGFAGIDAHLYFTGDDPAFDTKGTAILAPSAGIELRWPLVKRGAHADYVIEPLAQLVYSETHGNYDNVPNEDSLQVEFDAANVFAVNRYPGEDRREEGARLNLGANFTRIDDDGWQISATLGQVFRVDPTTGFPDNTGLNRRTSNIVAAANLDLPPYFSLSNQTLFDRQLAFSRNDIQATLKLDRFALDGSYVYLAADPTAGALVERHEFAFETRYQVTPNWTLDAEWRRDLTAGENVFAEAGIEYQNECLKTRFSASRKFTNSGTLPASTEFGLSVVLAGFGGSNDGAARRCVNY